MTYSDRERIIREGSNRADLRNYARTFDLERINKFGRVTRGRGAYS